MTIDKDKLKADAEYWAGHRCAFGKPLGSMAVEPATVLALLAEIERLEMTDFQKLHAQASQQAGDWGRAHHDISVERDQLKAENEALREEVAIDDKLIAERDRLLNLFECPDHGQCVPYAMEQVAALRKDAERYRLLREGGYLPDWAQVHPCDEHRRAELTDKAIDRVLGREGGE